MSEVCVPDETYGKTKIIKAAFYFGASDEDKEIYCTGYTQSHQDGA